MNLVDGALLVLMGLSALLGFWRGVVKECFALVSWVLAFVVCSKYAGPLSQALPLPWSEPMFRVALTWVLVFVGVLLAMALMGSVLKRLLSLVGLGLADRLLGMLFGALRAIIMWLAITVFVGLTPWRLAGVWVNSQIARWTHQLLVFVKPVLPAALERWVT